MFTGYSPFMTVVAGYQIANQQTGADSYFGFVNETGHWYIMKGVKVGKVTTYTYVKGASGYAAAWTTRITQTYDTFDVIF